MKILSFESSCDESAISIFDSDIGVLENIVHSQIDLHALYGGVVPDLASSQHLEKLPALFSKISKSPHFKQIDKIAATCGPGLPNCLAMGIAAAAAVAAALNKPLFGVNHLRGHAYSPFISLHASNPKNFEFELQKLLPHLGLIASGGNTVLFELAKDKNVKILAETDDDAAGEALDKGAKLLGMPYPGAPILEKTALGGAADKTLFPCGQNRKIAENPNFSFSGLKTSLRYFLQRLPASFDIKKNLPDICASYQYAVVEQLRRRVDWFAAAGSYKSLGVSGGVSNNSLLVQTLEKLARKRGAQFLVADKKYRGDNAAMIGFAAWFAPEALVPQQRRTLKMAPSMPLAQVPPPRTA